MRTWGVRRSVVYAMALVALSGLVLPTASHAATAQAIDASVDQTLTQFKQQHEGADAALNQTKGVLVFPQIVQAGVGLGGSYGEGALRVGGQTTGYYSIGAGSVGITVPKPWWSFVRRRRQYWGHCYSRRHCRSLVARPTRFSSHRGSPSAGNRSRNDPEVSSTIQ